jgi:ABC-type uncharacterized transport system substrate-binding protein
MEYNSWRAERGGAMKRNNDRLSSEAVPGTSRYPRIIAALAALALSGIAGEAAAHPHVLIDAHAELVFNAQGQLTGVTNIWDFDDAFSAFAIQGYDRKGDGNPTREELQPLAKVNLTSLAEYGYFTRVTLAGTTIPFGPPKDYFDLFENERLTLHFTLPLVRPLDVRGKSIEVDVYDPAYFAAITSATDNPVKLLGDGNSCSASVHRPEPLDPGVASQLAVIPADQRTLPPDLFAITNKLVNGIRLTCK